MLYLNQLDHRHVPFYHNASGGGVPEDRRNVATSGCGLCSMCMTVDRLTCRELELTDCVKLAEESGANWFFGVDMSILGPVVAEQYGLQYSGTKDPEVVRACLQKGGCVIANVTGDREGHTGLFSKVRHYIVVLSIDGDEVCILDPSYKEGKYEEEGRAGKARVDAPFVYCSLQDLQEDCICANPILEKYPYYHLFTRK